MLVTFAHEFPCRVGIAVLRHQHAEQREPLGPFRRIIGAIGAQTLDRGLQLGAGLRIFAQRVELRSGRDSGSVLQGVWYAAVDQRGARRILQCPPGHDDLRASLGILLRARHQADGAIFQCGKFGEFGALGIVGIAALRCRRNGNRGKRQGSATPRGRCNQIAREAHRLRPIRSL